jgi:hypothetical protein
MHSMMIGYTREQIENARMDAMGDVAKYKVGTSERKYAQGKFRRICLVESALDNWSREHRGCWYCWDDMKVVEEDREDFKNYPGYEECGYHRQPDPTNRYSGIPIEMRRPVKIVASIEDIGDEWDDEWETPADLRYIRRYDLVSAEDETVLLPGIRRCPYCGRDLDETWGREHRNYLPFWGLNDDPHDYWYDEVDGNPWGDDEYDD